MKPKLCSEGRQEQASPRPCRVIRGPFPPEFSLLLEDVISVEELAWASASSPHHHLGGLANRS